MGRPKIYYYANNSPPIVLVWNNTVEVSATLPIYVTSILILSYHVFVGVACSLFLDFSRYTTNGSLNIYYAPYGAGTYTSVYVVRFR
jgi:hypothetical protein